MRIYHGYHGVELWELIIDLMKLTYKDWAWISWSWVMRIDHESHEVELEGFTIDLMKLSDEDWSWISWNCVMRMDHGSHEVFLWGLVMDFYFLNMSNAIDDQLFCSEYDRVIWSWFLFNMWIIMKNKRLNTVYVLRQSSEWKPCLVILYQFKNNTLIFCSNSYDYQKT